MRQFARQQTGLLFDRLAVQLERAAQGLDPGVIHDLRVASRRLSRCLRVFAQFYPELRWRKVRRCIAQLMAAAGAVRDCDVALELLLAGGISPGSAMATRLGTERQRRCVRLRKRVVRWESRQALTRWRARLEL